MSLLTATVLAVLGAGAWWWIMWPEHTAREFSARITDGQWDLAIQYLGTDHEWPKQSQDEITLMCRHCPYYFEFDDKRPADDMLRGRSTFRGGSWNEWIFTAQFGRIVVESDGIFPHGTGKPYGWDSEDSEP